MTDDERQHPDPPDLSTLPPALRGGGQRGPESRGPLTVGRSLGAVAAGAGAGVLLVVVVVIVAFVASPGGFEGLGVVLLALLGGVVAGCIVAGIVVGSMVGRDPRGGRFTGVFSVVLALLLVAWLALAVAGLSGRLVGTAADLDLLGWVLVPLLWTLPAAAAGVVPSMWFGWVAGAGLLVAALLLVLRELTST